MTDRIPALIEPIQNRRPSTLERFWSKVVKTSGCWGWKAAIRADGYVNFWDGDARKMKRAHRYGYEAVNGPVSPGLVLDHLCRNRSCVNPDHLEPVTQQTNALRGIGLPAINAEKTHCIKGHELAGQNLYMEGSGRRCVTCRKDAARRYEARKTRVRSRAALGGEA